MKLPLDEIRKRQAAHREALAKGDPLRKIHRPHKVRSDGKIKVVDDDGHVYGEHDSDAKANAQLAALYAQKRRDQGE